jgi:hypothetical protein
MPHPRQVIAGNRIPRVGWTIMGRRHGSPWFGRYRSALAHRDLRLLLGGLVISATGTWACNVALLAFVFARTHSLAWVGAAGLARFVPVLLLSTAPS